MCVGAWTELLESEASRGAKRTEGVNVLTYWVLVRECMRDLRAFVSEIASDFYELFAKWRVSTRYQGLNEVKDLPSTRERTTPGWWKTSLKRALACLGVFWGFLPSEAKPYFFLVQNKKEYVSRHTPTPKNRSSLEKRIPNE